MKLIQFNYLFKLNKNQILEPYEICFICSQILFNFSQILCFSLLRISFIARYVYTYEEFVFATAMQQNYRDRTKNTDNKKN